MSRCRKEGINLSLHDVLRCKSILHLVERIGSTVSVVQKEEIIEAPFNLSPIQRLYFESASIHGGNGRFNQSFSLKITKPANSAGVKQAIEAIVRQHSMLRARFSQSAQGLWQQRITNVSHNLLLITILLHYLTETEYRWIISLSSPQFERNGSNSISCCKVSSVFGH